MSIKSLPPVATLLVMIAVSVMIGLGIWQLTRSQEKTALLAQYEASQGASANVPWPDSEEASAAVLYRRSNLLCMRVVDRGAISGRSADDEAGLAQFVECLLPDGTHARVILGWSRDPQLLVQWQGGAVSGVIAPGPRLVADPPLAGLEPNEVPVPSDLPNNHLGYAMQWFFFASAAVVIYIIALARRGKQ